MSQEQGTLPSIKQRRTRNRRHRPSLVTETANGELVEAGDLADEQTATYTEPLSETVGETPEPLPVVEPKRSSRLPNFFSKVEKGEQEEMSEADVVKARLTRATRTKAEVSSNKIEAKSNKSSSAKETAAPRSVPERPRLFKTKHFIGMFIYLIGAEFLLPAERAYLIQAGLEKTLIPTFKIFNLPISVTTSFLLNIATLIVFLFVLVKLDLLPMTFTASRVASQRAVSTRRRTQGSNEVVKRPPPPAIRQGVQGENDDLYRAYRQGQRKKK